MAKEKELRDLCTDRGAAAVISDLSAAWGNRELGVKSRKTKFISAARSAVTEVKSEMKGGLPPGCTGARLGADGKWYAVHQSGELIPIPRKH